MKAYTDYPFTELGDRSFAHAPVRECQITGYDQDKYCDIIIGEQLLDVKIGYLFHDMTLSRCITHDDVKSLPGQKPRE